VPNSQAVLQHLPFLRRYARALTGSQGSGDAYVAATLESLIASPEMLAESANSRVGLYRLFTKIWGSLAVNGKPEAGAGALPPEQHITQITPRPRQAITREDLLFHLERHSAAVLVPLSDSSRREFRIRQQCLLGQGARRNCQDKRGEEQLHDVES